MSEPKQVHLVILIHGLWGSPVHLFAAKEELEREWKNGQGHASTKERTDVSGPTEDPTITTRLDARSERSEGEELVVVIAGGMTSKLTYDGVDVCASRVAWEVDQEIAKIEAKGNKVVRFSVTGYSLGGLVARYLVGLLHSRDPSFFSKYTPGTFATIATPHLGIPRYNTFLSKVLIWLGSRLLSRSGEQLYVSDTYSDDDPRPLLEIMADPNLIFSQALRRFERIEIYANGVNDHTVPYPSAAIETTDHFVEWEDRGLSVDADEADLITSWSAPEPDVVRPRNKKGWGLSMGTLPPVLRYRFPFNYLIMLLFPIMLPLVMLLMTSRLALDTRSSRKRLQLLAQTHDKTTDGGANGIGPGTPGPSASSGLSIQSLREAIRRVEREIESDLISSMESPTATTHEAYFQHKQQADSAHHRIPAKSQIKLKDSQLRMALWLNKLPLKKHVTWYPDVANAHSVCVVRDPKEFPVHNRGRGLLRRWAKGVLSAAE